MNRIGFGFRFCAAVIDGLALGIVYGVVYMLFKPSITVTADTTFDDIVRQAVNAARWIILFNTLAIVGYSLTEVFFKAASPGKMLMNLAIVGENCETASRQTLLKRWGAKWGAACALNLLYAVTMFAPFHWLNMLVSLAVLGGFFMVFAARKQALHDVFAKTAVTQTAPVSFLPPNVQAILLGTAGTQSSTTEGETPKPSQSKPTSKAA
jgi:uncharacterized RDD family membrane protein YckC